MCEFKIYWVTLYCLSCHFNEHRVISAIKTLSIFQDWLALILQKYHLKEISLYFKTIIRQKKTAQFIESIWCTHDIWKHIKAKYNAHSLGNCILSIAPDITTALKIHQWKEQISNILFFGGKKVLFKESPPSIMVTRNPDWSAEILWCGTGCG
jgi:hypothetical protein